MNCRQFIENETKKDYFDNSISHHKKWETVVNAIGFDKCKGILNIPARYIVERYNETGDKYFNSWELYPLGHFDKKGHLMLLRGAHATGINRWSEADSCCIAKTVARMIYTEATGKELE